MKTWAATILCGAMLGPGVLRADEVPEPAAPAEPSAAPPAAPAIEYIPMRGFAFRTPDRLVEMAVGFNLQLRFTRFDFDQIPGAAEDTNEFRVRRFKLYFTGYAFDPRLNYRMQLAFENVNSTRLLLDDLWLNYKFRDEVSAQLGESKTPYSRNELYNDGVIEFQERASAVDAFKPGRDTGAALLGSLGGGRVTYVAGVFGGGGQNTLRASDHVMPMARIVLNPVGTMGSGEADLEGHATPALSVGIDGFTNTLRKTGDGVLESAIPNYASATGWFGKSLGLFATGENVSIESASADLQLKWRGLSVQGEYLVGHAKGDTSSAVLRAYGWYGQAGFLVIPRTLDLAVRYSVVDANRSVFRDQASVLTGASTWYFRGNHVKLQLDYSRTHRQRATGEPASDQLVRLQAQLFL